MKKYVGTKILEAEQMRRGEYNTYRGWTIPENENPEDEGYLVKYEDGYESWSPKDAFEQSYTEYNPNTLPATALMMQSDDYKERFKAEYFQLKIRIIGLKAMLEKYAVGKLPFKPVCSYDVLEHQLITMKLYENALIQRANIENIDLKME